MFSGGADELADPVDVAALMAGLPGPLFWKELPTYAHLDFVSGGLQTTFAFCCDDVMMWCTHVMKQLLPSLYLAVLGL